MKAGDLQLAEVPAPRPGRGQVLIRSSQSLVSLGTERMLVEFARAGWINKARQQPDNVRRVLQKIGTDGFAATASAVLRKLDAPIPLGYCNAGVVLEVGEGVEDLKAGDRVASNGPHAEIVCVPRHLCARVPDGVSDTAASFTVLSSVALQGVRLFDPTLGETVVVMGLGLVGLITCQILVANGCRVIGFDIAPDRVARAQALGAQALLLAELEDPTLAVAAQTQGMGADGVIITAATSDNSPIELAPLMTRKRGRVILVGVSGLHLNRKDFFEKEIRFQVSCSYGPGRYEDAYERKGLDYPVGYVRWTEQRNFEAVLELMRAGRLVVEPLVSLRLPFTEALGAYERLGEGQLAIIFDYGAAASSATVVVRAGARPQAGACRIGIIGAGDHVRGVLLPELAKTPAVLAAICSAAGINSEHLSRRYDIPMNTTDYREILARPEVDALVISTRHNQHAQMAAEGLRAGKHVFLEKPLALTVEDLGTVLAAGRERPELRLVVGYNRRFAPLVARMRSLLANRVAPLCMVMTVNAGEIAPSHWVHDLAVGGGRILGEACHFVDLMVHLARSKVEYAYADSMRAPGLAVEHDKVSLHFRFEDGSIGTVHYFANGHRGLPKERLEVFSEGRVLLLENFRRLQGYGFAGFRSQRLWRLDKGHSGLLHQFVRALQDPATPLIPMDELENVSRACFAALKSLRGGQAVAVRG